MVFIWKNNWERGGVCFSIFRRKHEKCDWNTCDQIKLNQIKFKSEREPNVELSFHLFQKL